MSAEQEMHPHRVAQVIEKCSRCEKILERQERSAATWKRAGVIFGIVLLGWGIAYVISVTPSTPSSKPEPRTTKCYFVRQAKYKDGEKNSRPWDPWRVWESQREGGVNLQVNGEASFASKADAWRFIQKWNLEPCR